MKTKLFTLIMLLMVSMTAFAQQKKVAVYVTGQESGINKVLGDQLVAAFAKSGKYIAIERTASFLAELSKEQNYQRTGAVSDNEISRLGKQFGVQLVCVVDVSDVFGQKYVSSRLIDVEKAEVINTANAQSSLNNMEELMRVSNSLKGQLFSGLAENSNVPQGYVDLGLPSGTLWPSKTVNAEYNYETALDMCRIEGAAIPSIQQWNELINECTWNPVSNGCEVQGRNGNKILLRFTGDYPSGSYWTSTCSYKEKNGQCGCNFSFFFNHSEQKISNRGGYLDEDNYGRGLALVKQN